MTNGNSPKLYIAGMGMVTPVGGNVAMTAAAVNAGISAYRSSDFHTQNGQRISLATVPNLIFDNIDAQIAEGDKFNERHDRVTKMAIIAIREACSQQSINEQIPLVLAMPEVKIDLEDLAPFTYNLEQNCIPVVSAKLCRQIHSGRAAGIDAIDFAFKYLFDNSQRFILVGGSDSYSDSAMLMKLDEQNRLLTTGSADGFVPGEASSFLLLTQKPEYAIVRNGHIIALHAPGIAEESGHLLSEMKYRGDGLDKAFKKALTNRPEQSISNIYSSMNGENYWAKEFGVAQIRNHKFFQPLMKVQHPADCYGDLGSASATTLISLAAESLFKNTTAQSHLVYSSSDGSKRGAIVIEKVMATTTQFISMN